MLSVFVLLVVIVCAAILATQGVFPAAVNFFCTIFAGLVAFNFFEPIARLLDEYVGFLGRYADFFAIMTLFCLVVTLLRLTADWLAPRELALPRWVDRIGGAILGGWTGAILAGILLCALQTLPVAPDFLGYQYDDLESGPLWNVDRRWLALVQFASTSLFERSEPTEFDAKADFVLRYHHFRRGGEPPPVQQRPIVGPTPGRPDFGALLQRRPTDAPQKADQKQLPRLQLIGKPKPPESEATAPKKEE